MTYTNPGAGWPASATEPAATKTTEQAMWELARRYGVEHDFRRAEAISQFLVDAGKVIGRLIRSARDLFGTLRRTAL